MRSFWRTAFRRLRVRRLLGPVVGPCIGFAFVVVVLCTAVFGNYIVTLFLPMIYIFDQHRKWREMMDRAITFWMLIPLFFLQFVYGVKVRASGDKIDCEEPAVIIMNHRTRLDWMYFWIALWRINPWLMTTNRIALKEFLRHVPGAGFGMQASLYIFLRRDQEVDFPRLERAIGHYSDMDRPYQILMFPEGTDRTAYTLKRSKEYARKRGLPELRNVLYPRTAGFVHMIKKMKARQYLKYVYDVTVAYPKDIVQNETDMVLKGRVSRNVHYDIRRYSIKELPDSDAGLTQWLNDLWAEKDARLEHFYAQRNKSKRKLDASGERNLWYHNDFKQTLVIVFGFFFWVSVVSVWVYHLFFLRIVQVGFAFLMLNYAYIYGVHGGIDNFIYHRWETWRQRRAMHDCVTV